MKISESKVIITFSNEKNTSFEIREYPAFGPFMSFKQNDGKIKEVDEKIIKDN